MYKINEINKSIMKRPIWELLQILKDNIDKLESSLCRLISDLKNDNILYEEDECVLLGYLRNIFRANHGWDEWLTEPRINWLEQKILEELEKIAIRVTNEGEGVEIVKYFERFGGFNFYNLEGNASQGALYFSRHGRLDCEVEEKWLTDREIYTLSELTGMKEIKELPREVLVGDTKDKINQKAWLLWIDSNPNANSPYHVINETPNTPNYETSEWRYMKELTKEITKEEAEKLLNNEYKII